MTIYILWYRQSSGDFIVGIFDRREKAEAKKGLSDRCDQRCMDIEEGVLE